MNKMLSLEQIDFFHQNYDKMTYQTIADNFGVKRHIVASYGKKCGIKKTSGQIVKYYINEKLFNIWTNDMAYILGYIMADGCVDDRHRLIINCKTKDKMVISFVRDNLSPTRPIRDFNEKINNKICYKSRLEISSKELVNSLREYNIIPRKTGCETLPFIPELFKHHYLRGYFDGDGCMHYSVGKNKYGYRYENKILLFSSGSQSFLEQIRDNLCFGYGRIYQNKQGTAMNLAIYKKDNIAQMFEYLYRDASFYLQRKYNKFIEAGF